MRECSPLTMCHMSPVGCEVSGDILNKNLELVNFFFVGPSDKKNDYSISYLAFEQKTKKPGVPRIVLLTTLVSNNK